MNPALTQLKHLADGFGASGWKAGAVIFYHNLLTAGLFVVLGLFFGIFPALTMWYNGLLMGYVTVLGAARLHVPEWEIIVYGLLPHGAFELPALVLSAALGMQAGYTVLQSIGRLINRHVGPQQRRASLAILWRDEWHQLLARVPVIVALFLVAAAVESMVTPKLIQWGL